MSYDLKKSTSGKFMFNLKAANHQVILTSQLYATKKSAEAGIASVQKHGVDEKFFELKTATSGDPYFILKASNGQTIGKSEMYKSTAAAKNGMASVQKNAPLTKIKDLA
ncbi:YegP family protein [Luteolibacter sp. AS25]|uniref:YegP family protein n=1 Tax=Luteolibacter sp. AS25 TaxID=3135776 RepID=UPI00398AF033